MRPQPSSIAAAEKGHHRGARLITVALAALVALGGNAAATDAPDAPGGPSAWTTGAKQGLGTSTTVQSKVWYTIAEGIVTEVYYPEVDVPNVQDLQLIVTDGRTFVDLERDATTHQVELADPQALTYRQVNTDKTDTPRYRITRTLVTDPDRPVLLIETRFEALSGGPYQVYILYNPSLNGSGMLDTAAISGNALVGNDGNVASALVASPDFTQMSNGYSLTRSDGLVDLRANRRLSGLFDSASTPGNVVQIGQLNGNINAGNGTTFTLALGFGSTRQEAASDARASLAAGFAAVRAKYENGWHAYLAPLRVPRSVTGSPNLRTQYNVALMALKAHEDKTFRGAGIASISTPWGNDVNADFCDESKGCVFRQGGYQAVFARDLYEVATAQLAAGDTDSANRYLDFLLNKQQLGDGSFPRNSRVNGDALPGNVQMDEVSYPIILAWQLNRIDAATWSKLKKSADFIVRKGPRTDGERWEEQDGFSPSTIAAEIAALICAADIAEKNGQPGDATTYLNKADEWQRNVDKWTFTTNGPLGDRRYYIRIDDNENPNDGDPINIANGGGRHDERQIVDAGFLELVRLGIKPANDAKVVASLPEIDATIKVTAPGGDMYHRYNFDGYGESDSDCEGWPAHRAGKGGLWPILSGERGEFALASGNPSEAVKTLETMARAANPGFMIPEQVFDHTEQRCGFIFGEGTGSATPLAWSMAQFVRLALSIDAGKPVETPKVVANRYARPSLP